MNKFLLLCCNLISIGLIAQTRLDTNTFIFRSLIPFSATHIVTVQQNWVEDNLPAKLYMQVLNGTQPVPEKLIDLKKGPLKSMVKGVFAWNGKINLLTSLYYPGPGRSNFIWQQFDPKTLNDEHSQIIDAVATPYPALSSTYLGYAISPDSSRIGFYSWIYAYSSDSVRLNVQVYNRKMEKEWSRQFKLPFNNNRFFINDCGLRSNGEFFLFAENYLSKIGAETVIKANRIEHLAFQFRPDRDSARIIRSVLTKGAFFSGLKFGIAPDEKLVGIGIWQAPRFVTESGIFLLQLKSGEEAVSQNIEILPKEMYARAERQAKQDSVLGENFAPFGFYDFNINKLVLQPDGQVFVAANYYNTSLLMRFDAEKKLKYLSILPGMQYGFLRHIYDQDFLVKGDSVYCLFTQVNDQLATPYKLIRVGENGELIHNSINSRVTTRRPKFSLNTNFCQMVNDQMVLLAATDSQVPFGRPRTITLRVEKLDNVFKE